MGKETVVLHCLFLLLSLLTWGILSASAQPSPAPSIVPAAPPKSPPLPSSPSPSPSAPPPNQMSPAPGGNRGGGAGDGAGSRLSGGQKAGIAVGVIMGAGVVGLGGVVYKKRRANIRRSKYGHVARERLGAI